MDQPVLGQGRVAALDGVRALAVCAVLAFHGGVGPFADGGFLGVDAFFVLSGFLISSLLLTEWRRDGHVRLLAFWGRRARRLLPALLLVVAAVVVAFRTALPPDEVRLLRGDALAALGYVANWRMLYRGEGGYFQQTASPSPLQHTWSLGIEEQFYLVWPLILVAVLALAKRPLRALLAVCVAGACASAVAMAALFQPGGDPSRSYYGSDTRAASLLIGCALAVLLAQRPAKAPVPRRALGTGAAAGILAIGWAWTHATGSAPWLYRGGLLAVAVAVAVVIADVALVPDGLAARALSLPPLPQLGLISYGVYLWHWPVFGFLTHDRTGLLGAPLFGLRCALTLLLALASFVLVEQPVRTGRWIRPRLRPALAVGALAAVAALSVAATVVPPPPPAPRLTLSLRHPPTPNAHASRSTSLLTRPGRPPGPPRIAFFGDSVAWSLGDAFPQIPGVQITTDALQGCGISPSGLVHDGGQTHGPYPKCPMWERYWLNGVRAHHPDVAVVLLGRWEVMDRDLAGRWRTIDDPVVLSYLRRQLERVIALLGASGARIVLCTSPYSHRHERPDGGLYPEDLPGRMDAWNRLVRAVAAAHPRTVSVADLSERVSPGGRFRWSVGGVRLRSDGLHFTPAGVRTWIAPWLAPPLLGLLSS